MEEGKYIILDFRNLDKIDYMKDKDDNIKVYRTEDEASSVCGMYEFPNAWVCKLIYNHIESEDV